MRIIISAIMIFISMTIFLTNINCNKGSGSSEEDLRIAVDALVPEVNTSPGPDYNFNLTVESKMPPNGVSIFIAVNGESDNQNYPQNPSSVETSSKTTRINLTNLPKQKICIGKLTVTSKSKPSNNKTINVRVAYK